MVAYIVGTVEVTDPEAYKKYTARVPAEIARWGGRFVIRGPQPEVLEGDWQVQRLVVIEFPDSAAARGWYESAGYQELVPLRQAASTGALALFEGFAG
ncbi:Uncharacterized conserved protein, DUF1330 family [Tistlia consotensis]|uniref:Uncharacterized conserved protein, DUF1330 family n=1 Tax=Tistlia consotensis USBA 355 TaxID=560819 RepID=A0A1Y6CP26_9PROT|nr:DUF1330 domain-containing protein [Tistlia consotensis]SMF78103.1 Uncharacterized conserved protein, DUF1330 family [Tistlia consotensis USBA 355]SNS17794.1 Uncharacterized conserved protein, DUF1330 family [Tistlia consotensis]